MNKQREVLEQRDKLLTKEISKVRVNKCLGSSKFQIKAIKEETNT